VFFSSLNPECSNRREKVYYGKTVQGLYSCEKLPTRISTLSTSGDVEVIDVDPLAIKSSLLSSMSSSKAHTYLFSAHTASFSRAKSGVTLVILASGTSRNQTPLEPTILRHPLLTRVLSLPSALSSCQLRIRLLPGSST